jgi:hypothetical protein
MALFDPAAVNRQIDAIVATVPPGKHVTIIGNADLISKRANAAIIFKLNDTVSAYARVGKTVGGPTEADAGFRVNFLFGFPSNDPIEGMPLEGFTYNELVAIFKARGFGWFRSHISAYKLLNGGEVEL